MKFLINSINIYVYDYRKYKYFDELVKLGYDGKNIDIGFSKKLIINWFYKGYFSNEIYHMLKFLQYKYLEVKTIDYILYEKKQKYEIKIFIKKLKKNHYVSRCSKRWNLMLINKNYRTNNKLYINHLYAIKYMKKHPNLIKDDYFNNYLFKNIVKNGKLQMWNAKIIFHIIPEHEFKNTTIEIVDDDKHYGNCNLETKYQICKKFKNFIIKCKYHRIEDFLNLLSNEKHSIKINNTEINGTIISVCRNKYKCAELDEIELKFKDGTCQSIRKHS